MEECPQNAWLDESLKEEIAAILNDFQGEESIKRLFWGVLSYDRERKPLLLSALPAPLASKLVSLELFASSASMKVLHGVTSDDLERSDAERICREVNRRMPMSVLLLHNGTDLDWTLIYPDNNTSAFLRLLALPGASVERSATVRALAAFNALTFGTDSPAEWLEMAEKLDVHFPGPMPRMSDAFEGVEEFIEKALPYLTDIKDYLVDIAQYPLLTVEQERGLGLSELRRPPDGSGMDYQLWRLVVHNLRLVPWMLRYAPRRLPIEDLVQEGNLGLMVAAERFDPTRKCRLSTYAFYWVRQFMWRAIANQARLIRAPVHIQESWPLMERTKEMLTPRLGRPPTVAEIAADMRISETQAQQLRSAGNRPIMFSEFWATTGQHLEDVEDERAESPERTAARGMLKDKIEAVLNTLERREREIIKLRYGIGDGYTYTLEEVGRVFDVTRERARQIEEKAMNKLQHPCRARRLEPFLALVRT